MKSSPVTRGKSYPSVTVSFLCHDGQGKILLNKRGRQARDEQGTWDGGGGALMFGEKVEETLKREIKEEYGADVKEYQFLGYSDIHRTYQGKPTHWIGLDFLVLIDPSEVKNNEPHKFDEIRWFSFDDLPSPLHSQFSKYKKRYCVNNII